MKKRLLSLLSYTLFWLVFFIFARLFFILFQFKLSSHESMTGLLGTFTHGIKLDISTTGYYLLLPFLLMIVTLFIKGRWYAIFMKYYTYLLIVFSSLIVVADASLYTYWGFRMDYTPVFYLKTPAEAMASVTTIKLVILLVAVIALSAVFILFYRRLINKTFEGFVKVKGLIPVAAFFLVLTGSLIIPVRGGFGIAPINAGSVYFSSSMYLNHTAINAVWNVGTSAFTQKPVENPYKFYDIEEAKSLFNSIAFRKNDEPEKVLSTEKPNVLLIILESFSAYAVGVTDGDSLTTPCLNRIAREGILFSNFYASGTRTDKAMPAILSGYPAQPAQSIIKEPKKSQSLPSLVRILDENGYRSSFWYGGEINFANFNSFIIGSGFRTIITKDNFDPANYNSKWGVHDNILFESLRDSMKTIQEPFLNVVLTLSSHEPYEIPVKPHFPVDSENADYRNSIYYTDSVIGSFIDWAKLQDWWKNTLIIFVADHGSRRTEEIPAYSKLVFRIPMIWTGGAVKRRGMVIDKLGGQVDIPLTVLDQMGINSDFKFSKDLLCTDSKSFAFYTYNEGFGFITDTSAVAYDHKPKQVVWQEGSHPEASESIGKAFLEVLFEDYLNR
ncbi:MAG TPA: sulfatase-like hydrolase/transferase [Bacteroidales bacterium]|nr:sulfatase-like hydrolase/transferase [Bacteroidales bacterium]